MPNSRLHTQLTHAQYETYWRWMYCMKWRHFANNNNKNQQKCVASPWFACSRISSSRWIALTVKNKKSLTAVVLEKSESESEIEHTFDRSNAMDYAIGEREQTKWCYESDQMTRVPVEIALLAIRTGNANNIVLSFFVVNSLYSIEMRLCV